MSDEEKSVPGDENLKVLPGTTLDDLTKPLPPPPPRPAFGGKKLITGKLLHPTLGEVDASDFITPREENLEPEPGFPLIPPDAVHGTPTPASEVPPFELPKDEDDPAGSVPAHHTLEVEQLHPVPEELRKKIEAHVVQEMEDWEKRRVEKAKKYLEDARAIAPDVSKTVKSIFNSLVTDGFTAEQALALTQSIIDKKLQPFL